MAFNGAMELESRQTKIAILAGNGKTDELANLIGENYTQLEIDTALENATAYSQIETAKYLLSIGADFSNYNYQGVYYAVHNNELEGVKFAIANGVDVNVNNGMLINTCVLTAINCKSLELISWLLDNKADSKLLTHENLSLIEKYGFTELKKLF